MKPLTILIADDHEIIRDGITALLEDEEIISEIHEAANGRESIAICSREQIDIVIMDLDMPEMDGVTATSKILDKCPDTRIIALSMLEGSGKIREIIRAGADGYLFKNSGKAELLTALQAISRGQHYFSEEAGLSILKNDIEDGDPDSKKNTGEPGTKARELLTEREREVLELICREFTNAEIADKLFISVRTVDAHRRNLLQKTGARNTAGLVRFAMNHGVA